MNSIVCLLFVSLSVAIITSGTAYCKDKKDKPAEKPAATSQSPSTIVATVNGTAITKAEMDRAMKFMLAQNRVSATLSDEERKKAETAVLDQLISAELLYQAGKKLEIKDIDKLVDTQMSQNKAKFPSPEAYDKALKTSGLTEKDLKEFSRKEIYINNLIEKQIASKVSVSDAEAKKFYDENKDKFKHEEMVRASHILVVVDPKASPEDKKKAREKAEALLKRVKGGEDFAAVAKKESGCPSAAQGGNLGYFSKGQMVPAFEDVAFSLKPGEISGVVETQFGFHIIKVDEKKPAGTETFDEVKQRIISFLKVQKVQTGITEYIDKLRKEGKVEIKA
jgi:peptidyl-prolyl cis-trans isomerase C